MVMYVCDATMKHKVLNCRVYVEINQESLQLLQLFNQRVYSNGEKDQV